MNILERLPAIISNSRELWERHTVPADLTYDAVMDRYAGIRQGSGIGHGADEGNGNDDNNNDSDCNCDSGLIITGDSLNTAKTLLAAVKAGVHDAPEFIYMDPPFFTNAKYVQTVNITGADGSDIPVRVPAFSDKWDEMGLREGAVIHGGNNEYGCDMPMEADGEACATDGAVNGETSDFARYLMMLALRITAAYDLLADSGSLWIHLDHHAAHYVKVIADSIFGGSAHLLNEVIWQYKSGGATKKHFARKHDTLLLYAKNIRKHKFYPLSEKSYNRGRKPYRFKGVKEYRDDDGWYTLVNMKDVWQIDMVGRTAHERTGYATQKPEALLERMVSSCTARGDQCIDMFGGSGTLAAVCGKLNRRWVTMDVSRLASMHAERRMAKLGAAFEVMDGSLTVADESPDIAHEEGGDTWDLSISRDPASDTAKPHASISVSSYNAPKSVLNSIPEYAGAIKKSASKHPAQFAAGIAIDTKYDGEIFRPTYIEYGQGKLNFLLPQGETNAAVAVRIIDIFGNQTTRVIYMDRF